MANYSAEKDFGSVLLASRVSKNPFQFLATRLVLNLPRRSEFAQEALICQVLGRDI